MDKCMVRATIQKSDEHAIQPQVSEPQVRP